MWEQIRIFSNKLYEQFGYGIASYNFTQTRNSASTIRQNLLAEKA